MDLWLRNVTPIVDYPGLYQREIGAFFALDRSAAQVTEHSPSSMRPTRYLRTNNPVPRPLPSSAPSPKLAS